MICNCMEPKPRGCVLNLKVNKCIRIMVHDFYQKLGATYFKKRVLVIQVVFNQFIPPLFIVYMQLGGEEEKVSYVNELKEKIEYTRKKMYLTYKNNPKDPQVLVISQELDKLLNEFDCYLKRDRTSSE